jgi:hypothetical protein
MVAIDHVFSNVYDRLLFVLDFEQFISVVGTSGISADFNVPDAELQLFLSILTWLF